MIKSIQPRVVVAGFALAVSQALGGTIDFNPSHVTVDPHTPSVSMAVSLETTSATALLAVIGSNDAPLQFIQYDPPIVICEFPPCPGVPGVYDYEVSFEAFSFTPYDTWLIGTLVVTTQHLTPGTYTIHALGEARNAADEPDPLSGSATITVIPEPATSLLAVGMGAVVMRRRVAA